MPGRFESFLQEEVSPGGIPLETPCLQSEAPPASMGEMEEAPAASKVAGDDQDNPEVFYTVERDESGEVLCLCSDTGEAYDKIAALAEYLLRDQQDAPVDEQFESLFWDGGAAEGPGGCTEAKTRGPSPHGPEAKRQRLAHPPALCIVSGDPLATPLNPSQDGTDSPANFHVQILVATVGPAGRSQQVLGPSASGDLWRIPWPRSNIQMILSLENAPRPCSPPDAATRPGVVRAFCKRLREHFHRECCPGPGQPLGHLYLERDLVQHHLDGRGGRSADLRRCHLGEKRKASVGRSSLFQTARKNGLGSRVIVALGKAGTGKSLLLQKICLDWAEGLLPQFDFVLRFDCRRLSLLQDTYPDFRSLLSDSLGGSCQGSLEDVYASLLHKPERVLLLFDSMGALKDPEGFPSAPGGPSCRAAPGLGAILAPLFQREMLKGCTLFLTGRPKERLPPYFPRVDTVVEVVCLSAEQTSLCLAGSLEGCAHGEQQADLIRASPYLFSHCGNPGLCHFICQAVLERRGAELPSTLTSLFVPHLLQKAAGSVANGGSGKCQALAALAEVAWSLGQRGQKALLSKHFPSTAVREFALATGLMVEQRDVCAFSSFVVHDFLLALHLTLAKEMKGKKLTKYLGWGARFRKCLSGGGLVPRFLSGLLFSKDELSGPLLFGKEGELEAEKMVARKQRSLSKFIRKLPIRDFSPEKLLELLHCVHETQNRYLLNHVRLELGPDLSFAGFPLPPPDVSVLQSVLRTSSRAFSLDLRGSCLPLLVLRELVGLESITKFRVSLGEAVALWKHLWDVREREALQAAMEKFQGGPFRAKTMGDVDALLGLVQLQRDMAEGEDSAASSGRLIPAIAGLLRLEFSLGPSSGWEGFQKLADSLVAFSALQHLDLDSPDENEIGDEGVGSLTGVLPRLASLEILNLSRNKITDRGAELLARALPSLHLLKTLSLYENNIGDGGAESVAEVLTQMSALRVLDLHCNQISAAGAQCLTEHLRRCPGIQSLALWNPMIPHRVLDHLQQLDSRIRRF